MAAAPGARPRGAARREALVDAAVDLVLAEGPGALTHRALAARADLPLASTTYHFATLDEILREVGDRLAARWVAAVAEVLADSAALARASSSADRAALLVRALLPPGDDAALRAHYEHLVAAGRTGLGAAYAAVRADLDAETGRLLAVLGVRLPPALVLAVADGAAVAALSEGRDVRATAVARLDDLLRREPRPLALPQLGESPGAALGDAQPWRPAEG